MDGPSIRSQLKRLAATVAVGLMTTWFGATAVWAAEASIKVQSPAGSVGLGGYVDQLNAKILADAAQEASGGGAGSGQTQFFDFNQSLDSHAGFDSLQSGEKALIRGAKRTYDLFKALGGRTLGRKGVAEVRDGRYYLTLDGEGGRWVASAGEALSLLGEQLAQLQLYINPEADNSIPCPFHFEYLLKSNYSGDVPTIAFVPRGTTLDLAMTGEGFALAGGPPVMIASDGINVLKVEYIDSENLTARISINADAPLGVSIVALFNEGTQFKSIERYGLNIVAGLEELEALFDVTAETTVAETDGDTASDAASTNTVGEDKVPGLTGTGTVELLADDYEATVATATTELSGQANGNLEVAGDVDVLKIVVLQPGTLTVTSDGPTDISGALEDSNGNVLSSDDDSGAKYNFSVQAAVAPGDYFVRISHCCGGKGTYRLTQQFQAN